MKIRKRRIVSIVVALALLGGGLWYSQSHSEGSTAAVKSGTSTKADVKDTTPDSIPDVAAPSFDKAQYSTTDPGSIWVVVNKKHALSPKNYAPNDLVSVGGGQYMRSEAAKAFTDMAAGAKQAGLTLSPASGYRSYDTQVAVYNNEVKTNGQATADTQSARPGHSEHQTGLVMDIAGGGCSITDCFGNTAEGKWAAANSYKYGYILRYTPADTAITGYRYESWHFRYIGVALATEMHNQNISTLEDFFGVSGGTSY